MSHLTKVATAPTARNIAARIADLAVRTVNRNGGELSKVIGYASISTFTSRTYSETDIKVIKNLALEYAEVELAKYNAS